MGPRRQSTWLLPIAPAARESDGGVSALTTDVVAAAAGRADLDTPCWTSTVRAGAIADHSEESVRLGGWRNGGTLPTMSISLVGRGQLA